MKATSVLAAIVIQSAATADPFQNLGFDNPDLNGLPPPPHTGTGSAWMTPGWVMRQPIGHNYTQPFWGAASILDANYRNTTQPGNPAKVPVVGQFSLGIWPYSGNRFAEDPFVLRQTGDIPAGSQSLRFLYHGDSLKVYVGGAERLVHFTEDRPSGDPELGDLHYFAVDVGLLAGTTAEIRFDFYSFGNYPGIPGGPVNGWPNAKMHVLDDLSFSPLPAVPEPQTWALFGAGLGAVLWFGRRR